MTVIINALGGLENPNLALTRPQGDNPVDSSAPDVDARAILDTHAAGVTAVNVTLGYVGGVDEPFEYTIRTVGVWDAILRRNAADLVKIHTAADIQAAEKSGKIGVIYGFQNGAMMGRDASRAGIFADLGVRVIQLTYNPANQIGHGCMSVEDGCLSAFGHEVVESLNGSRIMVDLSHSGTQTCLDAARASQAPVSINHTGCRAMTDLPRNKSDEELRLVASKGGFVGIYFMPFLKSDGHPGAEDVAAHIDHAIDVCGEDHVGIGTDGCYADRRSRRLWRVSCEAGRGPPQERPGRYRRTRRFLPFRGGPQRRGPVPQAVASAQSARPSGSAHRENSRPQFSALCARRVGCVSGNILGCRAPLVSHKCDLRHRAGDAPVSAFIARVM